MNTKGRSFDRIKLTKKENRNRTREQIVPESQPGYSFGRFLSDLGNMEIGRLFGGNKVQAKLVSGRPGDPLEREADKVASVIASGGTIASGQLGRIDAIPGTGGISNRTVPSAIESKIKSITGTGEPLAKHLKDYFEPRFGTDLGNIRIHKDSNANRLSQAVHARAFTAGNDIVFAKNEFRPESVEGRALLAHEITHTIQQKGEVLGKIQKQEDDSYWTRYDPNYGARKSANTIADLLPIFYFFKSEKSEKILRQFQVLDKTSKSEQWLPKDKASVRKIIAELKKLGTKFKKSEDQMYNWMLGDMIDEHKNILLAILVSCEDSDAVLITATKIYNLLKGSRSDCEQTEIIQLFQTCSGNITDRVLAYLESVTKKGRGNCCKWIFDALNDVNGYRLRTQLFKNGSPVAMEYGLERLVRLIEGIMDSFFSTSGEKGSSICTHFEMIPSIELRKALYAKIDSLCMAKWKQSAVLVLQDKMAEGDYEKLRGLGLEEELPAYFKERSWWTAVLDFCLSVGGGAFIGIEVILGIVWGVLTGVVGFLYDLTIGLVVDILSLVINVVGAILYFVSGNRICEPQWQAFKSFFTGIGALFSRNPVELFTEMTDELVLQSKLIGGNFKSGKQAAFWSDMITKTALNIVLIVVGVIALVKAGIKLVGQAIKKVAGMIAKMTRLFRGEAKAMELVKYLSKCTVDDALECVVKLDEAKVFANTDDAISVFKALDKYDSKRIVKLINELDIGKTGRVFSRLKGIENQEKLIKLLDRMDDAAARKFLSVLADENKTADELKQIADKIEALAKGKGITAKTVEEALAADEGLAEISLAKRIPGRKYAPAKDSGLSMWMQNSIVESLEGEQIVGVRTRPYKVNILDHKGKYRAKPVDTEYVKVIKKYKDGRRIIEYADETTEEVLSDLDLAFLTDGKGKLLSEDYIIEIYGKKVNTKYNFKAITHGDNEHGVMKGSSGAIRVAENETDFIYIFDKNGLKDFDIYSEMAKNYVSQTQ